MDSKTNRAKQDINDLFPSKFGAGSAASLVVFSFFDFVPDKALVLMVIGLTPFVALAVPQRIAPDIERGGQAFLAGAIGGAMQLVAGVTGPCSTSSMCAPA